MTLGRVAGERHSILSAARARTPPQSNRYFAFSVEFLETCQVPSCPSASDVPHASYKKTLQTQMMHLVELFSVPLTKPRLDNGSLQGFDSSRIKMNKLTTIYNTYTIIMIAFIIIIVLYYYTMYIDGDARMASHKASHMTSHTAAYIWRHAWRHIWRHAWRYAWRHIWR